MPPTGSTAIPTIPPHQAQHILQERIVLIPHDGQKPNYWLFLIVLGGIIGFAFLAACVGCLSAKCCRRKRNQKLIEEKAAADIENARRAQDTTVHAFTQSSSTLADEEDDIVERRTSNLLATKTFEGREQKLYAAHKKAKMNRGWRSSSIIMPVTLADLRKWAIRSVTSCDHHESQRAPNAASQTLGSTLGPSQEPGVTLRVPFPLHGNPTTSSDYDDPSRLVEDLCSSIKPTMAT